MLIYRTLSPIRQHILHRIDTGDKSGFAFAVVVTVHCHPHLCAGCAGRLMHLMRWECPTCPCQKQDMW